MLATVYSMLDEQVSIWHLARGKVGGGMEEGFSCHRTVMQAALLTASG